MRQHVVPSTAAYICPCVCACSQLPPYSRNVCRCWHRKLLQERRRGLVSIRPGHTGFGIHVCDIYSNRRGKDTGNHWESLAITGNSLHWEQTQTLRNHSSALQHCSMAGTRAGQGKGKGVGMTSVSVGLLPSPSDGMQPLILSRKKKKHRRIPPSTQPGTRTTTTTTTTMSIMGENPPSILSYSLDASEILTGTYLPTPTTVVQQTTTGCNMA